MRLSVENLAGERGGRRIFSGVGFALGDGGALVVSGPNGAGKSTLLRILAGLLPPADGTIRVDGDTDLATHCHYLGHGNAMKTALTVSENLGFWRAFLGETRLGVEAALDAVGLDGLGHLPYAYLSTGQRRRAAIARLLTNHRPLWLLDEPSAGLDTASEERLSALVAEHRADGGIVVAATHLPLGIHDAQTLRMGEAP